MSTQDDFKKSGYTVVKKLINQDEITRLYEYTLKNIERGNLKDGQVNGTPAFYQDPEMSLLQQKVLPKIEDATGIKLFTTFCYHRIYRTGAVLKAHKDRGACEISVSLNLGQKGAPWDLWLLDFDENTRNIAFEPGDAVIYRGSKLTHWRGKLTDADYVSQVFFHFVDQNSRNTIRLKTELLNRFLARCRRFFGVVY